MEKWAYFDLEIIPTISSLLCVQSSEPWPSKSYKHTTQRHSIIMSNHFRWTRFSIDLPITLWVMCLQISTEFLPLYSLELPSSLFLSLCTPALILSFSCSVYERFCYIKALMKIQVMSILHTLHTLSNLFPSQIVFSGKFGYFQISVIRVLLCHVGYSLLNVKYYPHVHNSQSASPNWPLLSLAGSHIQ